MWSNFFGAGGWGMYPTTVFGFLLLAAIGLDALRAEPRYRRIISALMVTVFASGLLGTSVGICKSAHDLGRVPVEKQLQTFALGCEESLHNLVLALIILVIANLVAAVVALRTRATAVR